MKALVCTEPNKVEVMEKELPDYTGKVLIKVKYAGICGSDLSIFHGKHPRAKMPLVAGHEFVGEVAAVAEGLDTDLKPGDRVVVNPIYYCGRCRACMQGAYTVCNHLKLIGIDCDGGMAQYATAWPKNVMKLPEDLEWDLAALIEPVAVVMHGMRMLEPRFFGSAVVTGGGPMGILSAIFLRSAGMSQVIVSEVNEVRLARAAAMGFKTVNPSKCDVVQEILKLTGGEGADTLVEASGSPYVSKQVTEMVQPRGKILMLSVFKEPALVNLRDINFKEQHIIGTRVYNDLDFHDAIEFTRTHKADLRNVISHVFELDQGVEAFAAASGGGTDAMKVVIHCE